MIRFSANFKKRIIFHFENDWFGKFGLLVSASVEFLYLRFS